MPDLPEAQVQLLSYAVANLNPLIREIQILQLANREYPLSYEEAAQQLSAAEPVWNQDAVNTDSLDEYCATAVKWLQSGRDYHAALPNAKDEGLGSSPGSGVAPLLFGDEVHRWNPETAVHWQHFSQWKIAGPFEQRVGKEYENSLLFEVVPYSSIPLAQYTDRLGSIKKEAPAIPWQTLSTTFELSEPWSKQINNDRFTDRVYYAYADFKIDQAQRLWISLASSDHARVWVDGRLIWSQSDRGWRSREHRRQIVKLELHPGTHRFAVKGHGDRRKSWLQMAFTDRDPNASGNVLPVDLAQDADWKSIQEPPLAWDLQKGINLAWRYSELGGREAPLLVDGKLIVVTKEQMLAAVQPEDGKVIWSVKLDP